MAPIQPITKRWYYAAALAGRVTFAHQQPLPEVG